MHRVRGSRRWKGGGLALALLLATALPMASTAALAEMAEPSYTYLHGIEDLPLMPGLAEVEEAGVVFDKPAGRIVVAFAEGDVSRTEVLGFYANTLPQLGWTADGEAAFHREGEALRIEFEADGKPLLVRFSLSPN
ncbi:MAG: hypothetical protein J4G10_00390 [Alphaproteobacteria bacterium]|nr:hypothetical protein [Alphaproteobacteria bacterium]